jgi:perosamine synthetase
LALGIGEGDEVIVPDVTWIASAAPITYVGAKPVFADINAHTWCLSTESFEACMTPRTKAVIPVDIYGSMPEMSALLKIAKKYNIAVIEDAAEAIGSEYQGKKAGSFGDTGVFSFHGSKTLTTGEGGMLVTNREDVYQRAMFLRDHGRPPGSTMFWNIEVAYKYKMSSMQAALGLAQLERVEALISRKREIFSWYKEALAEVEGITLNDEPPGIKNSYWMVTVIVEPQFNLEKDRLIALMREQNIDCRPFFHPLSSLPAYQHLAQAQQAREQNRVSYQISPYGINLPSALNITEEQVKYVCDVLKKILVQS